MIFYAAYAIVIEAINNLLGEEPDEELIQKIKTIISSLYEND